MIASMNNEKRILALDVRSRGFGYAVFEGPDRLLDWGGRGFPRGSKVVRVPASKKVGMLIDEFAPKTIVLKKRLVRRTRRNAGLIRTVLTQAKKDGIRTRFLTRRFVQKAFAENGRNKHKVACALAAKFPELSPKLFSYRRCQDREDHRTTIFDAAALGVAYLNRGRPIASETPPASAPPAQPN
jgi:hypothetical protein